MSKRSIKNRLCQFIVKRLPKRIVYWTAMRLLVSVTTGKYKDTVVDDLTCIRALNRFGEDNKKIFLNF